MFSNYSGFIGKILICLLFFFAQSVDCPMVMLFGEGRLATLACRNINSRLLEARSIPKTGKRKKNRNNFFRQFTLR